MIQPEDTVDENMPAQEDATVDEVDEEAKESLERAKEQAEAEAMAADAAGWESGSVGGDEDDADSDEDASDAESDGSGAVDWDQFETDEAGETREDAPVQPAAATPKLPTKTRAKEVNEKSSKQAPQASITSSMFLPSLNVGYTMGDYDSDPEEDDRRDNKKQGLMANGERKNRRGQRERRL